MRLQFTVSLWKHTMFVYADRHGAFTGHGPFLLALMALRPMGSVFEIAVWTGSKLITTQSVTSGPTPPTIRLPGEQPCPPRRKSGLMVRDVQAYFLN